MTPPTTPPPPPPPPQNVTITLVSRNLNPNADAGQLYAYVGDAPITRVSMPAHLNENAAAVRLNPGSTRNTATLSVPRGKTVTVIAVEFATNGWTGIPLGSVTPTSAPRNMVEFIGWEGALATPEDGVAVIIADADKTITANFDRVEGLLLRYLGCSAVKPQTTNTVGLLSFGRVIADTMPDLTSRNGFTQTGRIEPESDYLYMFGKQKSIITLRALFHEDRSPNVLRSGFIRWDGSAALCGTNLNCQLPIPVRGNNPAAMRLVSGYVRLQGGIIGCNCNPLTPNVPCTMLP